MDNLLQLQEPVTDGGIRVVNFFNGRLLTGRDMSRDQSAWREADLRQGLALGDGIARGLEVERAPQFDTANHPVVRVRPGLAYNRLGQSLFLAKDTVVALTRRFDATTADCLFGDCAAPLVNGQFVSGAGLFLLTIAPAAKAEGRAMTNGLDPTNVRCNTDAVVDAVQFRLIEVKPSFYAGLDQSLPIFRNKIVYRFFGNRVQSDWAGHLRTETSRDDELLNVLSPGGLSAADVPLCLIWLIGAAEVQFLDGWSVRRPLSRVESQSPIASLIGGRRPAIGQAMFLQFQDQIADLANAPGGLPAIRATSHFGHLPAAGILPLDTDLGEKSSVPPRFFDGMTCRGPTFINAARLETLIRESLVYPPIDTTSGEVVWLYRVRENRMPEAPAQPPYLVFASGHIPYQADAQFDLAYWDFSNFALTR